MRTHRLALGLVAFLVPTAAFAQPSALGSGRVASTLVPAVSVSPTSEQLVTACFTQCFATNGALRAQVCGTTGNLTPNPYLCLNRTQIPACALVQRSLDVGRLALASALCGRTAAAPATAVDATADTDRRRRVAERTRANCAEYGAFAEDCFRCAIGGQRWLPVDGQRQREMIRLAAGVTVDTVPSHAREAAARCVSRQTEAVYLVEADTRTRLENLTVTVANNARTSGGALSPQQAMIMASLVSRQTRVSELGRLSDAATLEHRLCQLGQSAQRSMESEARGPCDAVAARQLAVLAAFETAQLDLRMFTGVFDIIARDCPSDAEGVACQSALRDLHARLALPLPTQPTLLAPPAEPPPERVAATPAPTGGRTEMVMTGEE